MRMIEKNYLETYLDFMVKKSSLKLPDKPIIKSL